MTRRFIIIFGLFTGLLFGCGAPVEEPSVEPDPDAALQAASGFGQESWGIGTNWYNYDSTTHAVTPRALVYTVGDTSFEVTNYYDERGTSGFFSLKTAEGALTLDANVKEVDVCVTLDPLAQIPCGEEADLVFGTLRRPLPEAGFAVANPGFWAIPKPGLEVWSAPSDSPDERTAIPSVAVDPSFSRVALRDGVHLQIDPEFSITAWTVAETADGWRFDVLCGEADYESDRPLAEADRATVELDRESSPVVIDLCRGRVEDASPWLGLWPSGDYDLVASTVDGELVLKLHPAALHWNWGESTGVVELEEAREAAVWEGLE